MTFYVNLFFHVLTRLILESSEGEEEEKKECNLCNVRFRERFLRQ